jgi:MoxR-like ATPase
MAAHDWWLFKGDSKQYGNHPEKKGLPHLPKAPPWRRFDGKVLKNRTLPAMSQKDQERGANYQASDNERELVNAAIVLRRPLLVTGKPGNGKSTLAYAVAWELNLGSVLRWPITTRTTLQEALYRYDALERLRDASMKGSAPQIGDYIRLGPLGTALIPAPRPRVLLIDEIDKSDIDLPNDLLNVLEEGEFEIPELARLADQQESVNVLPGDGTGKVPVRQGLLRCREFPIIIMTSNSEREFPPAFLRRCLRLVIQSPKVPQLTEIVKARLGLNPTAEKRVAGLIQLFEDRRDKGEQQELATDQLLNALHLIIRQVKPIDRDELLQALQENKGVLQSVLLPLNASGGEP